MEEWVRPCHASHRIGDVSVDLLWPIGPVEGSENRRSCVYLLSAHGKSVLMMGDADWFAESQVVKALHRRNLLVRSTLWSSLITAHATDRILHLFSWWERITLLSALGNPIDMGILTEKS